MTFFSSNNLEIDLSLEIDNIINGYVEDLNNIEDFECCCCLEERDFEVEEVLDEDGDLEECSIYGDLECENCMEKWCFKCINQMLEEDDDNIECEETYNGLDENEYYNMLKLYYKGICGDCYYRRERMDNMYYLCEKRISFMIEVKGMDKECMEISPDCGYDSGYDTEQEWECWDKDWNEELEEWDEY